MGKMMYNLFDYFYIFYSITLLIILYLNISLKPNAVKYFYLVYVFSFLLICVNLILDYSYGITFRTELFDKLIIITFLVSGNLLFVLFKNYLVKFKRLFFKVFFIYTVIFPVFPLIITFLNKSHNFLSELSGYLYILMLSFYFWIIPLEAHKYYTIDNNYQIESKYEVRENSSILSYGGFILIEKFYIFEKSIGFNFEYRIKTNSFKVLKIISQTFDSSLVEIKYNNTKDTLVFKK